MFSYCGTMMQLLSFTILFFSSALNSAHKIGLEDLFEHPDLIHELVENHISIDSLIRAYCERDDLTSKEKDRFFRTTSKLRARLLGIEKKLKKQIKKNRIRRFKTNYFGDPARAENASTRQQEFYDVIMAELQKLVEEGSLDPRNAHEALYNLESLRVLHTANQKICLELAENGESPTYQSGPPLHFTERDIFFEQKAHFLFETLANAFLFAKKNHLLVSFFRDALAKGSGCLEARYFVVARWHKNFSMRVRDYETMTEEERENHLLYTAEEAINGCIENNLEILNYINHENKFYFIDQLQEHFFYKTFIDRYALTPEFILRMLETAFCLTPPSSPDATPPRSPSQLKRNS